ncbi:acetolactate synthase [Gallibacterium salpingitidis]|uniref:Acetolactate synthase n=1 Tax=Gallibacterium salpingitidis TaxID=505341 RepID=A0A1A7QDQ3_9PAST|nr:acetolactate synthase 2 small subunit [Gallibacterium salpingitidis]OBW94940.1 acetolactate synthase [Gallibacterium salpingitidis]OBX07139.1 acetolactate synthase [Gallibacterium salpingitidis]OBX12107.1 acetolactate synthase [Gallibacterium salpingitidis]WKS99744.1 acetolactate synthase 2 small subunit [Gallibacterium salpingitidis]
MNNYQISVQAEWRPETLERILRVVRHRGFVATALTSQLQEQQLTLQISLRSERELSLLTNQLVKLYGITDVTVLS